MIAMRIYPKGVTPRMFLSWFDYAAHHDPEPRRMGREASSGLAWIPDGSRTSPSRGRSRDRSIPQ
jgi:hypothetical protein